MRVLEVTIASIIEGFLEYEPRDAFAVDHSQTIKQLQTPVWVGGNDYKTFEAIQDVAIVFEVAGIIERLEAWNREVDQLRSEYFYNTMTSSLPDPFEAAFGFTSDVVFEYETIVKRCKMLIRLIESKQADASKDWIAFKTADSKLDRSNLARNAKQYPERLKKTGHGTWKVHPEFHSIYVK